MRVIEKIQHEIKIKLSLHLGLVDKAVEIGRELVNNGAKILVSRGKTTIILRNCGLGVPVLDYLFSPWVTLAVGPSEHRTRLVPIIHRFDIFTGIFFYFL